MVKFLSLRIKKKKKMKKRKKVMSVISELCMKIERDRKSQEKRILSNDIVKSALFSTPTTPPPPEKAEGRRERAVNSTSDVSYERTLRKASEKRVTSFHSLSHHRHGRIPRTRRAQSTFQTTHLQFEFQFEIKARELGTSPAGTLSALAYFFTYPPSPLISSTPLTTYLPTYSTTLV